MGGQVRRLSAQLLMQSGVRALNTRALDGVRRLLAPAVLEEVSGAGDEPRVSRHSAYRLWPERDQAVVDVARHVLDPDTLARHGVSSALDAYEAAIDDHVLGRQPAPDLSKDQRRDVFRHALAAAFHVQLRSDKRMAAWLLQIAATTCSPLWKEPPDPDTADYELGRQILEARMRCNEATIAQWGALLQGAMALFGRRPRQGYTVRDIVQLMCCMFDGSLLRLFVDPDIISLDPRTAVDQKALGRAITQACGAMYEIAWSCTEPGLLADPRRPDDPHDPHTRTFDHIMRQAAIVYQLLEPGRTPDLHDIASDAGQDAGTAKLLFPQDGDLADSVLRYLVKEHSEPGGWRIDDAAPWIESTLRALSSVASSHPAVVAAVLAHHLPPDPVHATGLVGELMQAVGGLLRVSRSLHSNNPTEEARHLVTLALEGPSGWWGAKAALDQAAARASRNQSHEQRPRRADQGPPGGTDGPGSVGGDLSG